MSSSRAVRRYKETTRTKRAPVLTPKELKRLFFVAGETRNPERNQLIVWLLFAAGFRISEIAQVEVKDVLWASGNIRNEVLIPSKYCKNGKAGRVYFYHKKLVAALQKYIAYRVRKKVLLGDKTGEYCGLRKGSKLIISENRRPYALKRKTREKVDGRIVDHWACDTLQGMVTTWGREAGIKGFTTHSGRRTFATRLARQGVPEEMICVLLRHQDQDMVYTYVEPEHNGISRILEDIYCFPVDDRNA